MPDGLLVLKRISLEFYSVLIGRFFPKKSLIIWLKYNEKSILLQFFQGWVFFNLFCLAERKLWLQRINVINKEMKLFEKEFYNLLNLTNLPQRDLQLNGGKLVQGVTVQEVTVWGLIGIGVIVRGELSWKLLVGE